MNIGPFELPNTLFVAPMAGVTDRPFRTLCRRLGAGYAVSEMVTSQRALWKSLKTSRRANHDGELAPIAVQIAGVDPTEMADAARYNIDRGAQIIDINMGCPAKKVCHTWAGSALMSNEPLAMRIVQAVVEACAPLGVPVTLKMRTGRSDTERNAVVLARAAEAAGADWTLLYGGRSEESMAFVDRLRAYGDRVTLLPGNDVAVEGCVPAHLESLVEKLREVRALVGFTRIMSPRDFDSAADLPPENRAKISRKDPTWLPACETRGEGIFFQFSERLIQEWVTKNHAYEIGRAHV